MSAYEAEGIKMMPVRTIDRHKAADKTFLAIFLNITSTPFAVYIVVMAYKTSIYSISQEY